MWIMGPATGRVPCATAFARRYPPHRNGALARAEGEVC